MTPEQRKEEYPIWTQQVAHTGMGGGTGAAGGTYLSVEGFLRQGVTGVFDCLSAYAKGWGERPLDAQVLRNCADILIAVAEKLEASHD